VNKIRGVNLGGWLVAEKWLTEKLFDGTNAIDEYTLMRAPGGKSIIDKHRRTFVTENDFRWLADHNINLVRIPVGYWLFDEIDGFTPSIKYLNKAFVWAAKHNIRVLICLHGARGSQNGFDNSGRAGESMWFTNNEYRDQTIVLLERIASTYKDHPALWGIELLNEPKANGHYFTLLDFHRHAYKKLQAILPSETHIVFHDAFKPFFFSGTFPWHRRFGPHPVLMDVHWYVFAGNTKDFRTYLRYSSLLRRVGLFLLQLWQPVIVGEWSTVLPQPFFDATPQNKHMDLLKKNADMQLAAYKSAAGWIYWNYKAQGDGMWNFRDLVERGVIKIA
jgi:glucan 1,3-beta-glucosidase